EQIGHRASHHQPIFESVSCSRRGLRAVGVDGELPGCVAADVDRVQVEALAADRNPPVARAQEIGVPEDELARQEPLAQKSLFPVAVGDDGVEEPRALAEPDAKALPLRAFDYEGNRVELPRSVRPLGDPEDVERDLLLVDAPSYILSQLLERGR